MPGSMKLEEGAESRRSPWAPAQRRVHEREPAGRVSLRHESGRFVGMRFSFSKADSRYRHTKLFRIRLAREPESIRHAARRSTWATHPHAGGRTARVHRPGNNPSQSFRSPSTGLRARALAKRVLCRVSSIDMHGHGISTPRATQCWLG